MSTKVFSGGAAAIQQVSTITPSALSSAITVISIKLTDHTGLTHSISVAPASTSVAAAVDSIVSTAAQAKTGAADAWDRVTVTDSTTAATVTADTAGQPFTVLASIESGPGSTATSTAIGNAGPNIFSQAENWVNDIAPADGDIIIIPANASDDIFGEDTTGMQFQGFTPEDGCGINIGHLNKYLQIDMKNDGTYYNVVTYGTGDIFLDVDNYHLIDIRKAGGGSPDNGNYACNIIGTHDADETGGRGTIYVRPGGQRSVSLGGNANESLKANKIQVWNGQCLIGDSVSASTTTTALPIEISGGYTILKSAATTITKTAGRLTVEGTGAIATLDERNGLTRYNGSGPLTNCNIYGSGVVDATENTTGATFTNIDMWPGAGFLDPHKQITQTNGVNLNKCGLAQVTLDLGSDITVTRTTI